MFIFMLTGCNKAQSATDEPESSNPSPAMSEVPKRNEDAEAFPTDFGPPAPKVSHAKVDYFGDGIYVITNDVSDEQALEIVEKDSKAVGEEINIPVYSDDELLLGKFDYVHGMHLCPMPGINYSHIRFANNSVKRTSGILSAFPGGAWRVLENGNKYLMYDTDKGTRYYIFFMKDHEYLSTGGYPLISCKKLAYADMESLKTGQTIDDVIAIDPTAQYTKSLYDPVNDISIENNIIYSDQYINTLHLLTDGIMKITYDRSGEEGNYIYTITDIEYHSDFKMESVIGDVYGTFKKEKVDYTIADEDYVD